MLEVCVDSLEGARIAVSAGADRIELCDCLEVGGVSPCPSLIRHSIDLQKSMRTAHHASQPNSKLTNAIALIRCRPGNFHFDTFELQQMMSEAQGAIDLGCTGIAVGASIAGDDLHWDFLESIAQRCTDVELVVHRVFDLVPNPVLAIQRLIELGYRRILTSGGAERAEDSVALLRQWQEAFGERIEILPAGGISRFNASEILNRTGCRQLHGSFRGSGVTSRSHKPEENAPADRKLLRLPDPDEIQTVRSLLDQWLSGHP